MKNLKKSKRQGKTNNYFINKTKAITIACFTAFVAFTACSKDDVNPLNCGSSNWVNLIQKELTAWSNAATAYSTAETTANCNNYKSATSNYLNALEEIKDCVPTAGLNDFNEAIQVAKSDLSQLVCP